MTKQTQRPLRSSARGRAPMQDDGWQDIFQGTSSIYTIDSEGHIDFIMGDYLVEAVTETGREHYRAYRQQRLRGGFEACRGALPS
jgi:hypothetical protein